MDEDLLDRWKVTPAELSGILTRNPSLRGFLFGYVAEFKLVQTWFSPPMVESSRKPDDHDRGNKCDLIVAYREREFRVEVKSLQTNSIKSEAGRHSAVYQCDASDRRTILLPNKSKVTTTCLLRGGFDLVAVNLFAFTGSWDFAFALNAELPGSKYKKYTPYQRKHLLASNMPISWPLEPPYTSDPFPLLDRLRVAGS